MSTDNKEFCIRSAAPLKELVEDMLANLSYWDDPTSPVRAYMAAGHPKVLFVAGENCSGKSFFVEHLRSWGKHFLEKGTSICISIRERTGAGTSDISGMRRVMMFGDESEQSTGATSVSVIARAFGNLAGRAEDGYRTLLVLDEPEIGLSEGYTRAMGTWLGEQIQAMPEKTAAVVVVSHSRALAKALQAVVGTPSFVHMGHPLGFDDWTTSVESRSVSDLLGLEETGRILRNAIRAFETSQSSAQSAD
jgi:hypothetical protein